MNMLLSQRTREEAAEIPKGVGWAGYGGDRER